MEIVSGYFCCVYENNNNCTLVESQVVVRIEGVRTVRTLDYSYPAILK